MSYITEVMMILTGHRDKQRFEDLVEQHEGFRPNPAAPHPNCTGNYVYCLGLDYARPKLLESLLEGPWARGSVLFIEAESWDRPQVKVFGDLPPAGWSSQPEVAL